MGNKSKEVRDAIRKISGADGAEFTFFHASVESVQDDTCTIDRNGLKIPDVALNASVDGNPNNLFIKPKTGSTVLIADLSDGQLRDLAVIGWSEVESITINGGQLGGLVKIAELTSKLNALVQTFNAHTHTVATTGTAAAQSGTAASTTSQASTFSASDYEDTKIKH